MKNLKFSRYLVILLLSITSTSVFAHTGVGAIHGFVDGLVHPWIGVDHLLVMVAIGLWAAVSGGRTMWLLPSAFLTAMVTGALLSFASITLTGAEIWVAFSVLALGLLLSLNKPISTVAATSLVAAFAITHGYVHAAEIGSGANAAAEYSLGFLIATAVLHAIGMATALTGPAVMKTIRTVFAVVCTVVGAALLAGV